MSADFDLVTIDTPDTAALAEFWLRILDLHISESEDVGRWLVLSSADGLRRIGLQRGAHRPGGIHLDLACSLGEFDDEVDRVVAAGGSILARRSEPYGLIANLADLDGNAFDLCAYTE